MQIDITARKFSLTDALRSHAEWPLRFAPTCFDDHIHRVVMRPTTPRRGLGASRDIGPGEVGERGVPYGGKEGRPCATERKAVA